MQEPETSFMRKGPPTSDFNPPSPKVDPEKYPNLATNPNLERALRIRQALDQGWPRDEAIQLAERAMGPRGTAKRVRAPKAIAAKAKARAESRQAPRRR